MKSVLPEYLEVKRIVIGRTHNRRVLYLLVVHAILMLGGLLLISHLNLPLKTEREKAVVALAVLVSAAAVFGVRQNKKNDEKLCRKLGFMCPFCSKPLYEARSFISINGVCPKCKCSIV